jgi:hypothetical protein
MVRHHLRKTLAPAFILMVVAGVSVPATGQTSGDTEVTVGSEDTIFSQNKQNEPSVAIDPAHPTVVAAGSNDNIDMEACNAGPPTDCPFTLDVGGTGVHFSFDSGDTWIQPTYTGLTARDCLGDPDPAVTTDVCVAHPGPIGTLPRYDEAGLVSDGDPALAFGPVPDAEGDFSWANGSRLYFGNLTSNLSVSETLSFKGFEAIAVSRIDGDPALTPAIVADQDNWMAPVIASSQSSATFADKVQVWADNAESSPFFGNAYVCYARFQGAGAAPMTVATSTDGGDTWVNKKVSPGHNVAPRMWGQSGCTIRTDSDGVVYVFYEEFQNPAFFFPPSGRHFLVQSFDGGASWTRPRVINEVIDPCYELEFDGASSRCVSDGIAGARNDLAASPNVSIANGAPTGAGATDEIVLTWVGFEENRDEHVWVRYSTDGGASWSDPQIVESPGDRGYYSAPALSPDGTDLYLVYNAFTTPFRDDTTSVRGLVGVVLHADVGPAGAPTGWTEVHRGAVGDPRGSAQNNIIIEFLGDYVYASATNNYAVAVWQDARNAGVCPAVQTWRAAMQADPASFPQGRPAIQEECPATFGNTDIFAWSGADPTP